MTKEKWADIFEDYKISSTGLLYKKPSTVINTNGKVLKKKKRWIKLNNKGKYSRTVLYMRDKSAVSFQIHRLVAIAFIPNPENKPFINHVDGNKSNNNVSNLEWCTASENTQHAYDIGLLSPKKGAENNRSIPIYKVHKETLEVIKKYDSIRRVKEDGYSVAPIHGCLHKKPHRKTAYGFIWKF